MVGSDMDSDGLLDLVHGSDSASQRSPAKRQQMTGSSSPPIAPTDINNSNSGNGDREGDAGTVAVKSKKVKAPGMESGSDNVVGQLEGDDEDSERHSPPLATKTIVTAKKIFEIDVKAMEDEDSVEPASQNLTGGDNGNHGTITIVTDKKIHELGEKAVEDEDSIETAPVPKKLTQDDDVNLDKHWQLTAIIAGVNYKEIHELGEKAMEDEDSVEPEQEGNNGNPEQQRLPAPVATGVTDKQRLENAEMEMDYEDSVEPAPARQKLVEGNHGNPKPQCVPTATDVTDKKILELGEKKAVEDGVESALAPKKLRSAINKCGRRSASSPLSDSKKKRRCISNKIQLHDEITEDEKEVIQALYALSRMIPACQINVKERTISEDNPNDNNISSSFPKETLMGKSGVKKIVRSSGSKASRSNVNEVCHLDYYKIALSCKNGSPVDVPVHALNSYSGNRLLQLTHNDAVTACHPGSRGTFAINHDVQQALDKRELSIVPFGQKAEAAPRMATPVRLHAPATATDHIPVELPQIPFNSKRPGGNCATHVDISHLIRSYLEKEKKNQTSMTSLLLHNFEEVPTMGDTCINFEEVPTLGRIGGSGMPRMSYDLGQSVERNANGLRSDILHNGRYMYSQQETFLSEAYDRHIQTRQFLPLSTVSESGNYGNNMMPPSGQLHAPFIPSQFSRHPVVPFHYSLVPNTTRFSDLLAAPATQQVQLGSHFYGSSPPYGMRNPSCWDASRTQPQCQQMWHARVVPGYRQEMELRMLQDARMRDPSHFWNLNAQHSSALALTPPAEIRNGPYHSPNSGRQLLLLGAPCASPSSTGSSHHQLSASPSQLKLLCDVDVPHS